MSQPQVDIYTKFGCGFCFRAKRLLDEIQLADQIGRIVAIAIVVPDCGRNDAPLLIEANA